MKTLAARGADGRTLAVAEKLNCMECLEGQLTKPSTKVALEKEEVIWRTLQMDTLLQVWRPSPSLPPYVG